MNEKSEALRLADMLEKMPLGECDEQAAAELRRLHAECEHHKAWVAHITAENKSLEAQRDALLEAFRGHVELHDEDCICEECAAIKAVEEGK